jgi:hypothetical protein
MTRKRTTENELVVSGGAAAAPRRSKASKPRSTRPATAAEAPSAAVLETEISPAETTSSVTTIDQPAAAAGSAHEEISRLAYSYWEARGYQGGSPEEDWLRAEMEFRSLAAAV